MNIYLLLLTLNIKNKFLIHFCSLLPLAFLISLPTSSAFYSHFYRVSRNENETSLEQ